MGYSTHFDGIFRFDRPLDCGLFDRLKEFNKSISTDFPGSYCQWVPNKVNTGLIWDGGENFYDHIDWLKWLIENMFEQEDYILNGIVYWHDEEYNDVGKIEVKNNEIFVTKGQITYDETKTVKVYSNIDNTKRQDIVDSAIFKMLNEVNPSGEKLELDIEKIRKIRDVVADIFKDPHFYP